jgi:hypothetical protein
MYVRELIYERGGGVNFLLFSFIAVGLKVFE